MLLSSKNSVGFYKYCVIFVECIRQFDILTILSLLINEYGMSFHLFLFKFHQCFVVLVYKFLASSVRFIPKHFIIFNTIVNGIAFLIFFSDCSWLIYWNITNLYILILYLATLLSSFISYNCVHIREISRTFYIKITSSATREIFTPSFPIWMHLFVCFFLAHLLWLVLLILCWLVVVRESILVLFLIFQRKSFKFFSICYDASYGLGWFLYFLF